ncbi:MAG: uroporphyrinogen decarboxylase family protein, partial [Chloroflexota bacterium]
QAIEGEWMKADEYDQLLDDEGDYLLRVYLPRVSGAMEALKMLPKMSSLGYGYRGAMTLAEALAKPEVAAAIEQLQKAGRESLKWRAQIPEFSREIEKLGFPINSAGGGGAPFDAISDNLRGMSGAMLDMYRQPDKLLETINKILARTLARIAAMPPRTDNPRAFMALHRGSDGFMSLKQFERFYWPGLKAVILAIIDKGIVPAIFFEGNWTARLEYLADLPRGKVLGHFDSTDIFKAKEVLKNNMCIRGNVPGSLLQAGSVQDVKDYLKTLIDVVGKDGGLIVCPRVVPDEAKPENLHAMIDFTKEYGIYR